MDIDNHFVEMDNSPDRQTDRTLIIKSNSNEFERFYNRHIQAYGVDVVCYEDMLTKEVLQNPAKAKRMFLWLMIKDNWRAKLKEYKRIIVFSYYGRGIILPLWLSKLANTKIYVWEWNRQGKIVESMNSLLYKMAPIYTFDPGDAKLNGWRFNQQFYFPEPNLVTKEAKLSAFFVGADKGRLESLKRLKQILEKTGVNCTFWVVRDKKSFGIDDELLHDEGLPYHEVMKLVANSSIVVDYVKPEQTGVTVRFLEAMFGNKKVITNNEAVRQLSVYDSTRVFIIGKNSTTELESFLHVKMKPYSKEEKEQFTFLCWLKHFSKV